MIPDSLHTANAALLRGDLEAAIRGYAGLLGKGAAFKDDFVFNLTIARNRHRRTRRTASPNIAVCGWEMGHNAAGRVRTLADVHAGAGDVTMIGALFPRWGGELWQPLTGSPYPIHLLTVSNERAFPSQIVDFVSAHPFDIVHLSKPRMPNILFGLFYRLIWDARVILDIDDEELSVVRTDSALELSQMPRDRDGLPDWSHITGKTWTRIAVGLSELFETRTVSNPALQARYGGLVLPHARSAEAFVSSPEQQSASRAAFGLPQDRKIVLFFGTARRHKGVIETARAVRALGRDDVCFVVAGDIPDADLAAELQAMAGPDLYLLPMQPYDRAADVVMAADICVLLQNETSQLAEYQFPAKLVDALAGELAVLVQPTPALADLIETGAVLPTSAKALPADLVRCLDDPSLIARLRQTGKRIFTERLSIAAQGQILARLPEAPAPIPIGRLLPEELDGIFNTLGGFRTLAPAPEDTSPAEPPFPSKVSVISWDMAHNPVGRAFLLADMVGRKTQVELVGPIFEQYGGQIWPPITGTDMPIRSFPANRLESLVKGALEVARTTRCDVVHLGKPRLSSLLIGALIRRATGCPLVLDIDDHELSFVQNRTPADFNEVLATLETDPDKLDIPYSEIWTRFSETLVAEADALTVSNVALQARFGGTIIRHGRDEAVFRRDLFDRDALRAEFGYRPEDRIILFLGTPRPHKGIFRLADALERLGDNRLALCVIGSVTDKRLLKQFEGYRRARIALNPDQPWERLAALVSMADGVAILQDPASPIAEFQIPAKLTDALALGIPVLTTDVPPLSDLKASGGFTTIHDEAGLDSALRAIADAPSGTFSEAAHRLFMDELSYRANIPRLARVYEQARRERRAETPLFDRMIAWIEARTGIDLSMAPPPRHELRAPSIAKASPRDLIFLWKQNDSDLYGRRSDMMARELLRSGKVRRILHLDAPITHAQLETQAQHETGVRPPHQGNYVYLNTLRRILRIADTPTFARRTFLYRGPKDPARAFGMDLPDLSAYPDFVTRALRDLDFGPAPLLWACPVVPEYEAVADAVRPGFVIADIIDDQRQFKMLPATRAKIEAGYRAVLEDADAVFCNCLPVQQGFAEFRQDIHVVPNGAEVFADLNGWDIPEDLAGLPRPIIGYVGNLRDRVDFDLIGKVAARFPQASVVLVGSAHGQTEGLDRVTALPNVHHLGIRPYDQANRIIRCFDVAMIPHVRNALSENMNPLKLYVYFALGVPIVSTDIANLGDLAAQIRIASDDEAFVHGVREALAAGKDVNATQAQARAKALAGISWQTRLDGLWRHLG